MAEFDYTQRANDGDYGRGWDAWKAAESKRQDAEENKEEEEIDGERI